MRDATIAISFCPSNGRADLNSDKEGHMATTESINTRIGAATSAEVCSDELRWDPWVYDARPDTSSLPVYGAGASQWEAIPATAPMQREIPERYRLMSPDVVAAHI